MRRQLGSRSCPLTFSTRALPTLPSSADCALPWSSLRGLRQLAQFRHDCVFEADILLIGRYKGPTNTLLTQSPGLFTLPKGYLVVHVAYGLSGGVDVG